jgi:ligand-binding sensor domain-containing protein
LHHVEIIDEIKGLSSNEITSIAQDKNGFLWIATLHGLNRYDGADINPDSAVEKKDLFLVNKSNCVAVEKNSL